MTQEFTARTDQMLPENDDLIVEIADLQQVKDRTETAADPDGNDASD